MTLKRLGILEISLASKSTHRKYALNHMALNTIALETALDDLGEKLDGNERGDLARLAEFYELLPNAAFQPNAARAPSIITRGEVQLFGNSYPRFANRLKLTEFYGFVNCRRLKTFLDQVEHQGNVNWGRPRNAPDGGRNNPDLLPLTENPRLLKDILARQSVIADSLLAQPSRLHQFLFRYLELNENLNLFGCYCEPNPAPAKGHLPYLKSFDLGGGVCSQSVCFMATVILAYYTTSICGIAEITALAHAQDILELSLSGFTPAMINTYFQNVGLRSHLQVARKPNASTLDDQDKRDFYQAICAYLYSGFPVILPVDHFYMAVGENGVSSIYRNNGWNLNGDPAVLENVGHAVLIVGHGERNVSLTTSRGNVVSLEAPFVFHDPAAMPFMVADLPELIQAGPFDGEFKDRDNGIFMPVTPSKVRLPLLRERSTDDAAHERSFIGLFDIAVSFRDSVNPATVPKPRENLGKFRLVRCSEPGPLKSVVLPELEDSLNAALVATLPKLALTRDVVSRDALEWVWLEIFPSSIWIWNAEEPPREEDFPHPDAPIEFMSAYSFYIVGVIYWNERSQKAEVFPPLDQRAN